MRPQGSSPYPGALQVPSPNTRPSSLNVMRPQGSSPSPGALQVPSPNMRPSSLRSSPKHYPPSPVSRRSPHTTLVPECDAYRNLPYVALFHAIDTSLDVGCDTRCSSRRMQTEYAVPSHAVDTFSNAMYPIVSCKGMLFPPMPLTHFQCDISHRKLTRYVVPSHPVDTLSNATYPIER